MKGAIGNAFIMNMVISFIIIFYALLIASMAITKTYKIKNFLVDYVTDFDSKKPSVNVANYEWWLMNNYWLEYDDDVDTLRRFGYMLKKGDLNCPSKESLGYNTHIVNKGASQYDYCVYIRFHGDLKDKINSHYNYENDRTIASYNYMVLVYMKFDFPIVGEFMKLPITGETKTINVFK